MAEVVEDASRVAVCMDTDQLLVASLVREGCVGDLDTVPDTDDDLDVLLDAWSVTLGVSDDVVS